MVDSQIISELVFHFKCSESAAFVVGGGTFLYLILRIKIIRAHDYHFATDAPHFATPEYDSAAYHGTRPVDEKLGVQKYLNILT